MSLAHEASRNGASDEFVKVLKKGRGTSAHKWAKKASKSGDWSMASHGMTGFAQSLFMGDTTSAWNRTHKNREEGIIEDLFDV